jgi:hypothetical protein
MATINLSKEEFVDFIVAFLLDKIMKGDEILPSHEDFNDLAKVMKSRGVDKNLLSYYIKSSAMVRGKYKNDRKVFTANNKEPLTLGIKGDVKVDRETKKTLQHVVKKALRMIAAQKRRRGFPLSEERVDKIIEHVIIEEGYVWEEGEE